VGRVSATQKKKKVFYFSRERRVNVYHVGKTRSFSAKKGTQKSAEYQFAVLWGRGVLSRKREPRERFGKVLQRGLQRKGAGP